MKKITLLFTGLCFNFCLLAQIKSTTVTNSIGNNTVSIANNPSLFASVNTFVEIYELPNYQGKMVKLATSTSPLTLPFTADKISIKRGKANFRVTITEASGNKINVAADVPELRVNNGGLTAIDFVLPFYIDVFENPNYTGKVKRFEIYDDGIKRSDEFDLPNLPFTPTLISIKFSQPNLLAYIYQPQQNQPVVFSNSVSSVPVNGGIRKIRIGRKQKIRMQFHGFLAEIHNNDCKRIRGWVKYNLQEKDQDNRTVITEKFANLQTAFDQRSGNFVPENLFNINNYWLLQRDGTRETLNSSRRYPSGKYSIQSNSNVQGAAGGVEFIVDEGALYNNRIFLTVYSKLNSAHKGCDLCSDYTDYTGMQQETETSYLLDPLAGVTRNMETGGSGSYLIQAGPYRVAGVGPDHLTYLQFGWMNNVVF
jgi:hypothetical protein